MTFLEAIILAVVQAATEFVPVSSSGHLVLVRNMLGWSDDYGILFDTVLHAGSLLAVFLYFRKDLWGMLLGFSGWKAANTEEGAYYRRLPWMLIVATIPVAVIGVFSEHILERVRITSAIDMIMLVTAFWFIICERFKKDTCRRAGWRNAIFMGVMQVFALLPGASRSGWTTGAGMLSGLSRETAARFSFLMAIPAIGGAIVFELPKIIDAGGDGLGLSVILCGFVCAFAVSLAAIHFCLYFFKKHSMIVFAVYLIILSGVTYALSSL